MTLSLLALLACATPGDPSDDSITAGVTSASARMTWEVHEIECEAGQYNVPAPAARPAFYTAVWLKENSQGEQTIKNAQGTIEEIRMDIDGSAGSCQGDEGTLVVTYAYLVE